jgi:hypothetical protein
MKKLAREILRTIVNDLPIQQREYGQAMLAELEEINDWTALAWAIGGIQLWLHTQQGAIMKMAAFWLGITGLYTTLNFSFAMSMFMATFDLIAFIVLRRFSIFTCRKPA